MAITEGPLKPCVIIIVETFRKKTYNRTNFDVRHNFVISELVQVPVIPNTRTHDGPLTGDCRSIHKNVSRLARSIRIRNHTGTGMIPGRCCRPAAAAVAGALPLLWQPSSLLSVAARLLLLLTDCC